MSLIGRHRFALELILQELELKKPLRILDVGCHEGEFIATLQKHVRNVSFFGIDVNREAIRKARDKVCGQFYIMPAENMTFPANYFDFVLALDVIEHVSYLHKSIHQIHRVLRRGGVLILSVPYFHPLSNLLDPGWLEGKHKHFKFNELVKLMSLHGFEIEKAKTYGAFFHVLDLWEYLVFSKIRIDPPKIFAKLAEFEDNMTGGWWGVVLKARKI